MYDERAEGVENSGLNMSVSTVYYMLYCGVPTSDLFYQCFDPSSRVCWTKLPVDGTRIAVMLSIVISNEPCVRCTNDV